MTAKRGLLLTVLLSVMLPLLGQDKPPPAHGIPFCAAPEPVAAQAGEALSGFAKSVLFLAATEPDNPSIYRAIYEDFKGGLWEIELVWDEKAAFLDIGDVTAESLGSDRAEVTAEMTKRIAALKKSKP